MLNLAITLVEAEKNEPVNKSSSLSSILGKLEYHNSNIELKDNALNTSGVLEDIERREPQAYLGYVDIRVQKGGAFLNF